MRLRCSIFRSPLNSSNSSPNMVSFKEIFSTATIQLVKAIAPAPVPPLSLCQVAFDHQLQCPTIRPLIIQTPTIIDPVLTCYVVVHLSTNQPERAYITPYVANESKAHCSTYSCATINLFLR